MNMLNDTCINVLKNSEFAALITWNNGEPHIVGTWGNYISIQCSHEDELLLIPAGHYHVTESNLKKNKGIKIFVGTKKVQGTYGSGQGCCIAGEGEIQTEGEFAQKIKEKFPWARGVLVVKVKECKTQL
jgi:hypothetical protein